MGGLFIGKDAKLVLILIPIGRKEVTWRKMNGFSLVLYCLVSGDFSNKEVCFVFPAFAPLPD